MAKKNLLEDWYKRAHIASSPLSIKPELNRDEVEVIYSILGSFFGSEYFIAESREVSIENVNWIHSLLAQKNLYASSLVLLDIVSLLGYYHSIKNELDIDLRTIISDARQTRNFFFELFVFRQLDYKQIKNFKNPVRNNQVLEGLCTLMGKEFLFECKKAYYPNLKELDIHVYIIFTLQESVEKFNRFYKGFLFAIYFKRPVYNKQKEDFSAALLELLTPVEFLREDEKIRKEFAFGHVDCYPLNEANFAYLDMINKPDVLFYAKPNPYVEHAFVAKAVGYFAQLQSKVSDKLKDIVEKAKRQHKKSFPGPKVFFIDSETYSEFQMGLFPYDSKSLDTNISERLNGVLKNEIVCIVKRRMSNAGLSIACDVYSSKNLEPEAKIIRELFTDSKKE